MEQPYDAVLIVSFGAAEGPDDVIPFLENVLRGKNVPRARLLAVAEHYLHFGGKSPLNQQNRALISALQACLAAESIRLPVYFGNRNWHPLLCDTLAQMAHDGVRRSLAFFTSAFSSYSGCRQYREDIERARHQVGGSAPQIDKLRVFFNHPDFIGPWVDHTRAALNTIPAERRATAQVVYTAHSIPLGMADYCDYVAQLQETARLVSESLDIPTINYRLAYQSRSGPPQQPWLEPDIRDVLRELAVAGVARDVVVAPIGFLSDHIEILWDIDTEARALSNELGLNMVRVAAVGTHPDFVNMIVELIGERVSGAPRRWLGSLGPSHDICPADCCLYGSQVRPT